jgi:hypothetical protein
MKTIDKLILTTTLALAAVLPLPAQETDDTITDPEIVKIQEHYQHEFDELEKEGHELENRAPKGGVNILNENVKAGWERHEIDLQIPVFKMEYRHFAIPSVRVEMKRRTISFDRPGIRMVMKVIGRYPEINHFHVHMKEIKTLVPEPTMEHVAIKFDVPEVKAGKIEVKTFMPKISTQKKRIIAFDLPYVNVTDLSKEGQEAARDGENLKIKGEQLAVAMKEELKAVSKRRLVEIREQLEAQHLADVSRINEASQASHASGAEPSALADSSDNSVTNLAAELDQVERVYASAIAQIDAELRKLDGAE